MNPLVYRFHSQGRLALMIVAVLLFCLVMPAPLALWVLWRRATGRVRLSDAELEAVELGSSTRIPWSDVARLGVLKAPVMARGVGGMLARWRMGGPVATHLFFQTVKGKDRSVVVSSFERYEEIVAEAQKRAGKPLETMKQGLLSAKWPEPEVASSGAVAA